MSVLMLCLSVLSGAVALAGDPKTEGDKAPAPAVTKKTESKAQATAAKSADSALDEKAALAFATQHHSELAELLQTLKRSNKSAYVDALKDVAREQDRLAKLADRDAERHALAVELWKLDSRIRLEMAKFAMNQDSERDQRVKALLKERFDVRRKALELDHKRAQTRVTKLEEQLATFGTNSEERAAAELERLKKSVAAKAKPKK